MALYLALMRLTGLIEPNYFKRWSRLTFTRTGTLTLRGAANQKAKGVNRAANPSVNAVIYVSPT